MKALVQEKEKAIAMRKNGYSYNEILSVVPVAKSSLSLWLKDLPLTKDEKKVLKKRTDSNISHGRIKAASELRKRCLEREQEYLSEATTEFNKYCKNPLFHVGIALYWAEGAKRSNMFQFMNSDEKMNDLLLRWIETFTEYKRSDLGYRLYLHHPFIHDNWEVWWQKKLNVPEGAFKKTVIKPTQLGIKKRPNYKGCLRIEVPRSTKLLIKMKFWINMMVVLYEK